MSWTFIVVQIAFWMALSTWFGAVIFVVMAPPVILRTVRKQNPLLPSVLSVNLEGQHGTLLAGSIIGELMVPLIRIELVCPACCSSRCWGNGSSSSRAVPI